MTPRQKAEKISKSFLKWMDTIKPKIGGVLVYLDAESGECKLVSRHLTPEGAERMLLASASVMRDRQENNADQTIN